MALAVAALLFGAVVGAGFDSLQGLADAIAALAGAIAILGALAICLGHLAEAITADGTTATAIQGAVLFALALIADAVATKLTGTQVHAGMVFDAIGGEFLCGLVSEATHDGVCATTAGGSHCNHHKRTEKRR